MKKSLAFIVGVAVFFPLVSCRDKTESTACPFQGEKCELSVCLEGIVKTSTRTAGVPADDDVVGDVQVFVFKRDAADGVIDAAAHFPHLPDTPVVSGPLSCTRGLREVWVLVNSGVNYVDGDVSDRVNSLSDLKSGTVGLAGGGSESGAFFMAGNTVVNLSSGNATVTVEVARMVSKIVLEKVDNRMMPPAYQTEGAVRITGAYLMNVAGIQAIGNLDSEREGAGPALSTAYQDSDCWYGRNVREDNPLFSESFAPALTVGYEDSISDLCAFYAFPNDADASTEADWSPRASVLVVCADIAGIPCVYPVQLPALESNRLYKVSLVIRHFGGNSDEPWETVEFNDLSPSIKVADWISESVSETI